MAEFYGSLEIFGADSTASILKEACERLWSFSKKNGGYQLDSIKHVFFGDQNSDVTGKIGCGGFFIDEIVRSSAEYKSQYTIHFSTLSSYPDAFSQYLVDVISKIDPSVRINMRCIGDGIHKVSMNFRPSIKT